MKTNEQSISTSAETENKLAKRLETVRSVSPQWKGAGKDGKNGNLGDFKVKTVTPSVEEFTAIAREFPEAVQEFLAGQLHIKFSGPKIVSNVRAALEAEMGKPEKGKSEEWHKDNAERAKALAGECEKHTIDFGQELREWAQAWKPEGASTNKVEAVKNAAAEALADALGITLEAAVAMLAAKMAR